MKSQLIHPDPNSPSSIQASCDARWYVDQVLCYEMAAAVGLKAFMLSKAIILSSRHSFAEVCLLLQGSPSNNDHAFMTPRAVSLFSRSILSHQMQLLSTTSSLLEAAFERLPPRMINVAILTPSSSAAKRNRLAWLHDLLQFLAKKAILDCCISCFRTLFWFDVMQCSTGFAALE